MRNLTFWNDIYWADYVNRTHYQLHQIKYSAQSCEHLLADDLLEREINYCKVHKYKMCFN